jgi:hypothetical protein
LARLRGTAVDFGGLIAASKRWRRQAVDAA